MADEDATTIAEGSAQEKGGKKGSPILTYIIIAVVMIAAGYFVGTTFSGGKSADGTHEEAKSDEGHGEEAEEGGSGHGSGAESANLDSEIYLIRDVIVNPSGTGGSRFLSVSIGFEVSSKESRELFEEREPIIKDALITILGSKTIDQLTDAKEKEITRFQIRKRVEHLLKVKDITAVYYTDYILQ